MSYLLRRIFHTTFTMYSSARYLTILSATSQIPLVVSGSASYNSNAVTAANTLQTFYNHTSGLWSTTGWWNSANCVTALADLTKVDNDISIVTGAVWPNTFVQAQKYNLNQLRTVPGATMSTNYYSSAQTETVQPNGFLNSFYDDEGWWALAWISVYDLTKESQYLDAAVNIFNDMASTGYNATCGGIWWNKSHSANVAIANELFMSVAAHLANRAPNAQYYLSWAMRQWTWFQDSGLINSNYNINDGLNLTTCQNNNSTVWSYNQGVILGALVELNTAAPNTSYLSVAQSIASAAIAKLSDANGILHDPYEPNLGADGGQFKGIFVRNLQILQQATGNSEYRAYLESNAQSIWTNGRNQTTNMIGPVWSGPPYSNLSSAATQSSGLDALVGAAAVQ